MRREAIEYLKGTYSVSLRRACGLIGLQKSSFYYEAEEPDDGELRDALKQKAVEHRRWGYRNLIEMLRRDGWKDNHKRIYRVYVEEGLQVRKRRKRWASKWRGEPLIQPTRLNEVWAMDFVADMLTGGRRLRLLPVIDVYSRECLAIEVDTSLTGQRVSRVLDQLREVRGRLPERIMVDNGPEFAGRELDRWAYENGVKLHFIQPGKPMQNGYIESFNGKFRNECLNEHWFPSVNNARQMTEDWRQSYNQVRPHSSLGKQTPAEFAALHSRLRSATPPSAGNVPNETVLQTMGGLS